MKAQLAARGEPPEPVPNRGGLLPRYFAADWATIYARHCERSWTARMLGWEPPYHGCDADEWPVPGRTLIPRRAETGDRGDCLALTPGTDGGTGGRGGQVPPCPDRGRRIGRVTAEDSAGSRLPPQQSLSRHLVTSGPILDQAARETSAGCR